MTTVVFSIDTERDSSHHVEGNPFEATALGESKAGFSATEDGLKDFLSLLKELEVPATFFFEAQTALELKDKMDLRKSFASHEIGFHGFHHEDFTGIKTGIKISQEKRRDIIESGKRVLEEVFARKIHGFRAPYLGCDDDLLDIVRENFDYDSSFYGTQAVEFKGLKRIPVLEGMDASGKKRVGFLWPLMKGNRTAEDYVELVKQGIQANVNPIVLATHSWHTRMTRKTGRLSDNQAAEKLKQVKAVLEGIASLKGVEFATLDACAD